MQRISCMLALAIMLTLSLATSSYGKMYSSRVHGNWESFILDIANTFFPALRLTSEDLEKSEQYRTEHLRLEERQQFSTLEDYLKSLDMKLYLREVGAEDVGRAAQLTQKTNQFNLTTRRYTESDIIHMMQSSEWKLWIGELEDRFGKYGKIILAIVHKQGNNARFDTFLMSCRVMGREVENVFLNKIEHKLTSLGVTTIKSEYLPTQKNAVVADFWLQHGYHKIEENYTETTFLKKIPSDERCHAHLTLVYDESF